MVIELYEEFLTKGHDNTEHLYAEIFIIDMLANFQS